LLFFRRTDYGVRMKRCTVSVIDGDGEQRQVAVNAASLFDAVDQAIEQWSRLGWFNAGAVGWRFRLETGAGGCGFGTLFHGAVERAGGFSEAKVRTTYNRSLARGS
jgi:hypothetical protein